METKGIAHIIDAKDRTNDVRLKELAPFNKMLLSAPVRKGLHAAGFMYPTIVQATAIPVGKSGLDLLIQSKSGTGKTLIFSTIVLEFYQSDIREPQSLIVAPTREIAIQIAEIINEIGKYCTGFRAACVIGGLNVAEDRQSLRGAKCVVGTPGRILHLLQNDVLNTSQIAQLVIDEADKMYTHAFRQDLDRIRKALPNQKQIIACSATFIDNLDRELAKIMKNPLLISTEARATMLVGIKQFVYELPEQKTSILEMQQKLEAVRHIFGRISFKQCLIFAGSQCRASSYRNYLEKDGWFCEVITGAQNQKLRLESFRKFREFKTRILIATDLMARGVDYEHVDLVINLELPTDVVTYLHRVGRAGRFGSHGVAINILASKKDHQIFRSLLTELGTGLDVLKFPLKDQSEKEPRDIMNFNDSNEDVNYFGIYENDEQKLLAPLASQDNTTLSSSLSDNKENLSSNISSNQESSIDTNTFLVNSKDSALQVPNFCSSEQIIAEKIVESPSKNVNSMEELHILDTPPPPPNPSENVNPAVESYNSSSNHLLTSNTIDDASSIAADSLRSSQQDISRYQSILMQKSAIPTLVEFLVDRHASNDSQTKENGEHCTKIDLFDAYTKEVLNNNESETEAALISDEPKLSSNKLTQLKSLLIDEAEEKSHIDGLKDPYSDFANFQEDEMSSSVSEDIDKQTFILSVATPSIQQDSFSELQNNSSDLYPASDEINTVTDTPIEGKEQKHFPSPRHNEKPTLVEFMPDISSGATHQKNQPPQHNNLQQKLSINKTTQIEILPYQSPQKSVSRIVNGGGNVDRDPSPTNGSSTETASVAHNSVDSDSDIEPSGNTSGFDEKTSTSGSSGIESSEHHNARAALQLHRADSYTSSESDSEENDDETLDADCDEDSEHYFDTDEDVEEDDSEEDEEDEVEALKYQNNTPSTITPNHTNSSNTITNVTPDFLNCHSAAYSRWVDIYWNQMTLVQDYVKFSKLTRHQRQTE